MLDMLFNRAPLWVIGPGLFLFLCIAAEAGFRLQQWLDRRSPSGTGKDGGAGHILGVSLGLMSLLLSFTFSIAIDRYDARRSLVLEEANAIGTAYQRADILAEPLRSALIGPLRDYTQVRIAFYEAGEDEAKLADVEHRTGVLQNQLWATTAQAVHTLPNTDLSASLMDAMNHMFDQAPARKVALAAHIPVAVLFGLTVLLLASAVMLGAVLGENRRRHPFLALMLLALLSFTMTLIVDIDRPRQNHVLINQGPLLDLRAALLSTSAEP
jgi:hypothetical protein